MSINDIFYPSLVICGLLGLGALVAVATTSWLFNVTDGRLRQCPNCKRKGAGYIFQTDTLDTRTNVEFRRRIAYLTTHESLEDHYECEHCGHTWIIPFNRTTREKRKPQNSQQTYR